jgi:hypothetical protein
MKSGYGLLPGLAILRLVGLASVSHDADISVRFNAHALYLLEVIQDPLAQQAEQLAVSRSFIARLSSSQAASRRSRQDAAAIVTSS